MVMALLMVMVAVTVTVMAYGTPKPFGTRKGAAPNRHNECNADATCAHD